jgi:phosphatidylethanolamine-binding protein (PEBP) family uncharacterized protein
MLTQNAADPVVSIPSSEYNWQLLDSLSVAFGDKAFSPSSKYPNVVAISPTGTAPLIGYSKAVSGTSYTLVMVDSDAYSASSPSLSPVRHWVVANIPGQALAQGNADLSQYSTLSQYFPPQPPAGTKWHRYYMFLYKQAAGVSPTADAKWSSPMFYPILVWDFVSWASSSQLSKVAMNWFITEAAADVFDTRNINVGSELACTAQGNPLKVQFGVSTPVTCLTELPFQSTQVVPTVVLSTAVADAKYTVMMVDFDALSGSDPSLSPIRHWLISDVPGSVLSSSGLSAANYKTYRTLSEIFFPGVRAIE